MFNDDLLDQAVEWLKRVVYTFDPLHHVPLDNGKALDVWSARDALVLKALQLVLGDVLPVHEARTHVRGNGGLKRAVFELTSSIVGESSVNRPSQVLRTDVKSYYASIDHGILLDRLSVHISDKRVINLISRFLKRSVEFGGTFSDYSTGISRVCAFSPLLGAFYLHELDGALSRQPVFYIRYMDDIAIAASNPHKLRRAIVAVNQVLFKLKLEKHPDKTFIGKADRGFDFLGYHFRQKANDKTVVSLAKKTIENFENKLAGLQEQAEIAYARKSGKCFNWERPTQSRAFSSNKQSRLYQHKHQTGE